jgi:hypothetical protein
MPDETTKPDGEIDDDGKTRPVADRAAVRNQGEVSPEDYPEPAAGEQVKHRKTY